MRKLLFGSLLSILVVMAVPLIISSPGYALVACHLTKIGPNAPKDVTYPPGCQNTGDGNQKVLELARAQLGDAYGWGTPNRNWAAAGPDPKTFDCSGLVGWAYYNATGGKVSYPGSTKATWPNPPAGFEAIKTKDYTQMQPGDPVYFGSSDATVHHVGLFIGKGECGKDDCFIHAPQTGDVVRIASLGRRNDILGVVRPKAQ